MIINKIKLICAILLTVGALTLTLIAAQKYDSHPAFAYGVFTALLCVHSTCMAARAFQKEDDKQ